MESMQFHITRMDLFLGTQVILHVSGLMEPFGINKKCSQGFNVGLITYLCTSLSNGFALIFKVFINIHEYANEIIFV